MPIFPVTFRGDTGNLPQFASEIEKTMLTAERTIQSGLGKIASTQTGISGVQYQTPRSVEPGTYLRNAKVELDKFNNAIVAQAQLIKRSISDYTVGQNATTGQFQVQPVLSDAFIKNITLGTQSYERFTKALQGSQVIDRAVLNQRKSFASLEADLLNLANAYTVAGGALGNKIANRAQGYDTYRTGTPEQQNPAEFAAVAEAQKQALSRVRQTLTRLQNLYGIQIPPDIFNRLEGFQAGNIPREFKVKGAAAEDLFGEGAARNVPVETKYVITPASARAAGQEMSDEINQRVLPTLRGVFSQAEEGFFASPAIAKRLQEIEGTLLPGGKYLGYQEANFLNRFPDVGKKLQQQGLGLGAQYGTDPFFKNAANQGFEVNQIYKDFEKNVTHVSGTMRDAAGVAGTWTYAINENGKAINRWGGQLSGARGFLQQTSRDFIKVIEWTIATTAVFGTLGIAIRSLSTINELNENLQRFAITAQLSNTDAMKTFKDLAQVAYETATPITELLKAADDMALATRRSGQSTDQWRQQILDLSRAVGILTNISGLDTVRATELLTAAMKQLNLTGTQTLDVLNKAAAAAGGQANSITDIVQSLGTLTEAADAANLTLDQQIASVQVISQVTGKSAADVATAFKNLFGALGSDAATNKLKEFGIAVRDSEGNIRPFLDVYKDISDALREGVIPEGRLNEVLRAISGGPRRAPDAAALLSNINRVFEVEKISANASNEALIANAEILTTNNAKIRQLQSAFDANIFEKLNNTVQNLTDTIVTFGQAFGSIFGAIPDQLVAVAVNLGVVLAAAKLLSKGFGSLAGQQGFSQFLSGIGAKTSNIQKTFNAGVAARNQIGSVAENPAAIILPESTSAPFVAQVQAYKSGIASMKADLTNFAAEKERLEKRLSLNATLGVGRYQGYDKDVSELQRIGKAMEDTTQKIGTYQNGLRNLTLITSGERANNPGLLRGGETGFVPSFITRYQNSPEGQAATRAAAQEAAKVTGDSLQQSTLAGWLAGIKNVAKTVKGGTIAGAVAGAGVSAAALASGNGDLITAAQGIAGIGLFTGAPPVQAASGIVLALTTAYQLLNNAQEENRQKAFDLQKDAYNQLQNYKLQEAGLQSVQTEYNQVDTALRESIQGSQKYRDLQRQQGELLVSLSDASFELNGTFETLKKTLQGLAETTGDTELKNILAQVNAGSFAGFSEDLQKRIVKILSEAILKASGQAVTDIANIRPIPSYVGELAGKKGLTEINVPLTYQRPNSDNAGLGPGGGGFVGAGAQQLNLSDLASTPEKLQALLDYLSSVPAEQRGNALGSLVPATNENATLLFGALNQLNASGQISNDKFKEYVDLFGFWVQRFGIAGSEAQNTIAGVGAKAQSYRLLGQLSGEQFANIQARQGAAGKLDESLRNNPNATSADQQKIIDQINNLLFGNGPGGLNVGAIDRKTAEEVTRAYAGQVGGDLLEKINGSQDELRGAVIGFWKSLGVDVQGYSDTFFQQSVEAAKKLQDAKDALAKSLTSGFGSAFNDIDQQLADLEGKKLGGDFKDNLGDYTKLKEQLTSTKEAFTELFDVLSNQAPDAVNGFTEILANNVIGLSGVKDNVDALAPALLRLINTFGLSGKQAAAFINDLIKLTKAEALVAKGVVLANTAIGQQFALARTGEGPPGAPAGPGSYVGAQNNNLQQQINALLADMGKILSSGAGSSFTKPSGTGGTKASGGGGPDVSNLDIPEEIYKASNRSALIQEAIQRARELQSKIPGATKDARNDIVELLHGTQRLQEVRGVKEDLLRKALEELAAVEKARLDFDTKASVIQRIRVGAGSFAGFANVPLNPQTGVSVGGPQGPISVNLNIAGQVLTPAQFDQLADKIGAVIKNQIANG